MHDAGYLMPEILHRDIFAKKKSLVTVQETNDFCWYALLLRVFSLKLLCPSLGIDDLLLAGIKGMALRTDIHVNHGVRGLGDKCLAAGASDLCLFIVWMNSFLQGVPPSKK